MSACTVGAAYAGPEGGGSGRPVSGSLPTPVPALGEETR